MDFLYSIILDRRIIIPAMGFLYYYGMERFVALGETFLTKPFIRSLLQRQDPIILQS